MSTGDVATWAAVLEEARHAFFVGRQQELARLEAFLETTTPKHAHIWGPGGCGKTALLQQLRSLAARQNARIRWLDGALIDPAPAEIRALQGAAEPSVILVDSFEKLAPIHQWFRQEFLTELPPETRGVTAGRQPLPPEHWQLTSIELGDLTDAACRELLRLRGVPAHRHTSLIAATHGYPLALDLAAMLDDAGADNATGELDPLVERLLEDVPSELHRRALWAASLVLVTTKELLEAMVWPEPPPVHELDSVYGWLASRSFMSRAPVGLQPHPLVRDILEARARASAPDDVARMIGAARSVLIEEFLAADAKTRETTNFALVHLHRNEPGATLAVGTCQTYMDSVRPEEIPLLDAAVLRHEGARAAELAAHWRHHCPQGLFGCRDENGRLVGFVHYLELGQVPRAWRVTDPALETAFAYLERHGRLREGEMLRLARFWMSLAEHQAFVPVQSRLFAHMGAWLLSPDAAVAMAVHAHPDAWLTRADQQHDDLGRFEVDGVPFGLLGTDTRRRDLRRWFHRFYANMSRPPGHALRCQDLERAEILDRDTFVKAVDDALARYHDAARLAEATLMRSRALREHLREGADVSERVRALRELLRAAIERTSEELSANGIEPTILAQTYLKPTAKQYAVAMDLGLPFSTYRRHLGRAVTHLAEHLWARELGR